MERDNKRVRTIALLCLCVALACAAEPNQVQRVVIIKVDGLPGDLLERSVKDTSPGRDGHSRELPVPVDCRMQQEGNAYLMKDFGKLDYIKKASIEP